MKPNKHLGINVLSTYFRLTFSNWGFSWNGVKSNQKGEWLLFSQLFIIAAHLIPPWPIIEYDSFNWGSLLIIPGVILVVIGIILTIKAFISLGISLSPLPEPKKNAPLVTTGSYQNCRHPLYQAILCCSTGITLYFCSLLHLILLINLSIILRLKAKREERTLIQIHSSYKGYMAQTTAIFKYIRFLDWQN